MLLFSSYNIRYKQHPTEGWVMATGEIRNESPKSYNTVIFRARIFHGDEPMGSAMIKIQGFRGKITKPFTATFTGVHHSQMAKISKCEVLLDSMA
jgi:hypothetical protein